MPSWIIWVVVLVGIVAAGAAAWFLYDKNRTGRLKSRFGPEYDRTLESNKTRRSAEAELESRARRVEMLHIRDLSPADQARFAERWLEAQSRFVDEPGPAVAQASTLVKEVLGARGYPVGDFEQRTADISVDHPAVVEHYREARRIAQHNERGQANTEDLRLAMVHYRALFEDLLGSVAHEVMEVRR